MTYKASHFTIFQKVLTDSIDTTIEETPSLYDKFYEGDLDHHADNISNTDDFIQQKAVGDDIIQIKTATNYKAFDKLSVFDDLWMPLNNGGR